MASSSESKRTYDVFLSFRGTDQRNKFAGHLYRALDRSGIYTFRDNEELRKGDEIFLELMKAIEESCIAIIVFSEDYASSWWCLEEVAKIMECKKQKYLTVLPVFYKVDPREVRTGRESYARALAKHESKYGKDSEKVKIWKEALLEAGNLSGWPLIDEDESELVQEIVEEISTYLARTPLHVAKHPVGIDYRVVKLKSILNLKSDDGVLMVGLWGPGGIGKTSLAKALYNAMFRQFDGACFLEDVQKTSKGSRGLVELQNILLNDILLPQKKLKVSTVSKGINLIQHRLGGKRVLLILDNVDELCQLNALAGECKWFGNGSKIIVTTRNKHLLICHRIDQDHVYEVEALNHIEAHELLSKHAFQTHPIRKDLVDSALNYAKGLPLALEVLGSLLCGTTEDVWESTLMKLSRNPEKTINSVLKVSYDGLDKNEKEIFLHIACFFRGWDREYTKKVLDSCEDLYTTVGFDTLIKRALISIELGILKVHDLIQAMGIDIVNQECPDDPGRRSRLWQYDDVLDVLSCDIGNCAVKAIVLKLPEPIEMYIGPDAFTKIKRLRLLILHNVHDSCQGPICLPNELRWFEWPGCARQIPEFSSSPNKLVGLNMSGGNITTVVKQFKGFQNLKYINFSQCESLVRMPDLSCTPNLEKLDLQNCKNLVEAHQSIAHLDKLQVLNFWGCSELSVFPNELKLKNLRTLNFEDCTKFEKFPYIPHKLEALKELYLSRTAIKGLPTSIENLVSLEHIYLRNCKNLTSLPSSIYKLQNLEDLNLDFCTNLIRFPKYEDLADPCMKTGLSNLRDLNLLGCNLFEVDFLENLSCFPLLASLDLSGNNITSLPTSVKIRHRLSHLNLENCRQLREIPKLPPFLRTFWTGNCESLQNHGDLTSVHDFVHRGLTRTDICPPDEALDYSLILPQGEIPEWVIPFEEDSISFVASEDLYDKFFGFALCVTLDKDNYQDETYHFVAHVNGVKWKSNIFHYNTSRSDLLQLDRFRLFYLTPPRLWGEVDFGRIDGSRVHFSLTISGKHVKKRGFRIFCKQLEDDLKIMLQDDRLIDPALLYEIDYESTYSEVKSLFMHRDGSTKTDLEEDPQDRQRRVERDEQIAPKRKHELIPAQGKRIKTTSTSSDSTDGEENDRETCEGSSNS